MTHLLHLDSLKNKSFLLSMLWWQLTRSSLVTFILAPHQIIKHFFVFSTFPTVPYRTLNACILCKWWLLPNRHLTTLSEMSLLLLMQQSFVVHSFHVIFILDLLNLIHQFRICIFDQFIQLRSARVLNENY